MNEFIEVFQRPDYVEKLVQTLQLSILALVIGIIISVPLAVAVNRSQLASTVSINTANIGRAIPSLALLALALPFLGIGFAPSLFALTLIAIPPILINGVVGLRQVNPQVMDAAKGMGLSGRQILTGIQIPIAAPIIFAGIRTSAVQVVASSTLATFIGGGGFGDYIVEGYQRSSTPIALAGALSIAVLAILTEVGFGQLEKVVTPKGLRIAQKRGRVK